MEKLIPRCGPEVKLSNRVGAENQREPCESGEVKLIKNIRNPEDPKDMKELTDQCRKKLTKSRKQNWKEISVQNANTELLI